MEPECSFHELSTAESVQLCQRAFEVALTLLGCIQHRLQQPASGLFVGLLEALRQHGTLLRQPLLAELPDLREVLCASGRCRELEIWQDTHGERCSGCSVSAI